MRNELSYIVGIVNTGPIATFNEFIKAQDYVLARENTVDWYIDEVDYDGKQTTVATKERGKWHGRFEL